MLLELSKANKYQINWLVAFLEGYDHGWLTRQLTNTNLDTRAIPDFSTVWSEGGPVMDREWDSVMGFLQRKNSQHGDAWHEYMLNGEPVLAAFMRGYVSSKFDSFIEVPDALMHKEISSGDSQERIK